MPGLLQAPNSKFGSAKSVVAVAAEFLGVRMCTSPSSPGAEPALTPWCAADLGLHLCRYGTAVRVKFHLGGTPGVSYKALQVPPHRLVSQVRSRASAQLVSTPVTGLPGEPPQLPVCRLQHGG